MRIILFSAFAGIVGTGLGGLLSIALGKRSPNMTCWMLSFAGGVMTSIVCFGLVPEAIVLSNTMISFVGLIAGILIVMGLNRVVDRITETGTEKLAVHQTPEELYHESRILADRHALSRSGFIMFAAIALHNIPEGMAIGAGGSHDLRLGALLAVMITLHNIPEGMAIAAPLLGGGLPKGKVLFLTAFAGASTLIGGIGGALLGNISDTAVALSFAAAGGAMLYVVFGEIIPQSVVMTKSRAATVITLIGIIIGLAITQI